MFKTSFVNDCNTLLVVRLLFVSANTWMFLKLASNFLDDFFGGDTNGCDSPGTENENCHAA